MRALLLVAMLASVASADDKHTVGILDVRVEGVAPEAKVQFGEKLEQQLAQSKYTLLTQPKMHDAMAASAKFTEGCIAGPCLSDIRSQTHAELVLLVAFNGSGTTYGYVVTLVRTETGRVLSQHADRCDVCTVNEAMTKATKATLELLDAVPEVLPDENASRKTEITAAVAPFKHEAFAARRHFRKLGTGLAIAGGLVTVSGIVALLVSTGRPAVGITAAGVGLLAGGVTVLSF